MLSVEGMNDIFLVSINLIINIYNLLYEISELLHLLVEESFDVDYELSAQDLGPLEAGLLLRDTLALRTVIQASLVAHAGRGFRSDWCRLFSRAVILRRVRSNDEFGVILIPTLDRYML